MFDKVYALGFPIYKFYYDKNKIDQVYQELLKLEYNQNPSNMMWSGMKEDATGINLHSLPQFKEIFLWFHDCLKEVKKDMRLTCDELKIVSSWANLNKTNESFHSHQHPNCFMSSNYYASGVSNDKTVWYVENPYFKNSNLQPISSDDVDNGSLYLKHVEDTEPGKYVVFPPSIMHYATKNTDQEPRTTIAANIYPNGTISCGGVSKLKIKVVD